MEYVTTVDDVTAVEDGTVNEVEYEVTKIMS